MKNLLRYFITRVVLTIPMLFILLSLVFGVLRIMPGDPVFATLELSVAGMFFTLIIGIPLGSCAASKRRTSRDFGIRLYGNIVYCIPVFWMGLMLQLIFGIWLDWLPIAGRTGTRIFVSMFERTGFYLIDTLLVGNFPAFFDVLVHLLLPSITPGIVLAARARGIPERNGRYRNICVVREPRLSDRRPHLCRDRSSCEVLRGNGFACKIFTCRYDDESHAAIRRRAQKIRRRVVDPHHRRSHHINCDIYCPVATNGGALLSAGSGSRSAAHGAGAGASDGYRQFEPRCSVRESSISRWLWPSYTFPRISGPSADRLLLSRRKCTSKRRARWAPVGGRFSFSIFTECHCNGCGHFFD